MKVKDVYAATLKSMAKNGVGITESKEQLMKIAVAIQSLSGADLDREAWICEDCGEVVPDRERAKSSHKLTHSWAEPRKSGGKR